MAMLSTLCITGKLDCTTLSLLQRLATGGTEVPNEILQLTCHFWNDIMTKVQIHKVWRRNLWEAADQSHRDYRCYSLTCHSHWKVTVWYSNISSGEGLSSALYMWREKLYTDIWFCHLVGRKDLMNRFIIWKVITASFRGYLPLYH